MRSIRYVGVLTAAVAMLAMSVGAMGAQAAEPVWHVKGAELPAGTTEAFSAKQKSESEAGVKEFGWTISGMKITISCKKFKDAGELVGGTPGTAANEAAFEKCKSSSGKLANETITLTPSSTTLVWQSTRGEEALERLAPTRGTQLAAFELKEMPLKLGEGRYELVGEALAEVRPVALEVEMGELVFPPEEITKYFTGNSGSRTEHSIHPLELNAPSGLKARVEKFAETAVVTLTSKSPWGVFQA